MPSDQRRQARRAAPGARPETHEQPAPAWLVRLGAGMLAVAILLTAGLALALARGAADPPRAGPLRWEMDFKQGAPGWTLLPPAHGRLALEGGALRAHFGQAASGQAALALTHGPAGDFTLEVAGAGQPGESLAYGLVFDWRGERHYSALVVNGNGYARAWQQRGDESSEWFAWQQWPHILAGGSANRVRVDVRGQQVTLRVNDELLASGFADGAGGGQVGALAQGDEVGSVSISWVRLWAPGQ